MDGCHYSTKYTNSHMKLDLKSEHSERSTASFQTDLTYVNKDSEDCDQHGIISQCSFQHGNTRNVLLSDTHQIMSVGNRLEKTQEAERHRSANESLTSQQNVRWSLASNDSLDVPNDTFCNENYAGLQIDGEDIRNIHGSFAYHENAKTMDSAYTSRKDIVGKQSHHVCRCSKMYPCYATPKYRQRHLMGQSLSLIPCQTHGSYELNQSQGQCGTLLSINDRHRCQVKSMKQLQGKQRLSPPCQSCLSGMSDTSVNKYGEVSLVHGDQHPLIECERKQTPATLSLVRGDQHPIIECERKQTLRHCYVDRQTRIECLPRNDSNETLYEGIDDVYHDENEETEETNYENNKLLRKMFFVLVIVNIVFLLSNVGEHFALFITKDDFPNESVCMSCETLNVSGLNIGETYGLFRERGQCCFPSKVKMFELFMQHSSQEIPGTPDEYPSQSVTRLVWKKANECRTIEACPSRNVDFTVERSLITIKTTGYYFVYSQVSFRINKSGPSTLTIGHNLTKIRENAPDVVIGSDKQLCNIDVTTHSSRNQLIQFFKDGDKLSIVVKDKMYLHYIHSHPEAYIGLFLLNNKTAETVTV